VPDTFLQVDAIHNVMRAAEMTRDSLHRVTPGTQ
jgi:hypothetical protein